MSLSTITSTLPGIKCVQGHIEYMLENTAVSTYWKDKKGKYLGVNAIFVKTADLSSPEDIVGYTDRDFIWGDAQAVHMQRNDNCIIQTGKPSTVIETATSYEDRKLRQFLSYKTPLLSRTGKTIGVFGVSYKLDGSVATSADIANAGFSANLVLLNQLQNEADDSNTPLTARQLDCIYYLVKGFSTKQIAKILLLSPRTIEHYLENIKIKLDVDTRVELIAKALKMKAIRARL